MAYDYTYDGRECPFTKLEALPLSRLQMPNDVGVLAHCFAVCHGDWGQACAAMRLAKRVGLVDVDLPSYVDGPAFAEFDNDEPGDVERLQDLAHDFLAHHQPIGRTSR